jgi:phosphate starvation-inducible PhoH-like protein
MARKKKFSEEEETDIYNSVMNQNNIPQLKNIKLDLKFKNSTQKLFAQEIENQEIIFASGPAGTGKTFIACGKAIDLLKKQDKFKKIFIVKSVTTLKDEEIGYLKGTMEEKLEPYVYSFIHNFEKLIGKFAVKSLRDSGNIEVMPIAFVRGINFDECVVIIDEAQNLTRDHLITILTRIGTNCKMILLGDTDQIDRKFKTDSGFSWIIDKCKDIEGMTTISFNQEHIVRNPIIGKILEAIK